MSTQEEKKKKSPPEYEGAGQEVLLRAVGRVLSGETFSYDPDTDPAYKQYEETYTRLGQRAMEDTLGRVSARTGGLAGSYAATAAQQSYDQYMTELADKVPELRQLAYDMYRDERNRDLDKLEVLRDLESEQYDRWRDKMADYLDQQDFDRDVLESDRAFDRDVLESDRAFDRDVLEADRAFDRNVLEADRKYDRQVYESDRDYDRRVYESDRDYDQDVLEADRDYELDRAKAAKSGTSSSDTTKTTKATMGWDQVQAWADRYGAASAEDYIRENYKKLGYSTVNAALAGWSNYTRQQDYDRREQQRRQQAERGIVLNGDGQPVHTTVRSFFDDLVELGMSDQKLTALVEDWAAQGWYGLDEEGALALLATIGL